MRKRFLRQSSVRNVNKRHGPINISRMQLTLPAIRRTHRGASRSYLRAWSSATLSCSIPVLWECEMNSHMAMARITSTPLSPPLPSSERKQLRSLSRRWYPLVMCILASSAVSKDVSGLCRREKHEAQPDHRALAHVHFYSKCAVA